MSKHTPGPWYPDPKGYVWRRPLTDLYEYGGAVAGDKPLATVCKGWWGENEQGYPVEANARLIAAAPDLLAVCQELEQSAEYWSEYNVPLGIVDRIKAAIAKATGDKND